MVQMRITSVYAQLPSFDDDIIVLMRDPVINRAIKSPKGVNRSAIINYLIRKEAERARRRVKPINI